MVIDTTLSCGNELGDADMMGLRFIRDFPGQVQNPVECVLPMKN
jgi:hypothetical protein